MKPCSVPGCPRPHSARGYCGPHYKQMTRSGLARPVDPHRYPVLPLLARVGRADLLEATGADYDALTYAIEHGLDSYRADKWAIACGLHPSMVWPSFDADALTPLDDVFVNGGGWRHAWLWRETERAEDVAA